MRIIICGLPGTGKTTLSKIISEKYNIDLISDWNIFNTNEITINEFENKNDISKKYSKFLLEQINNYKNVVVDLEYSISPQDFVNYGNKGDIVIYLGFVSVDKNTLFSLFRKSETNNQYDNETLLNKISFYKQMSLEYKNQCEKLKIKFIDINKDRGIIFNNILKDLEKVFCQSR